MTNILNNIIKYPIYLLVFLLPLFFLPFSFEIFEFNKQYLLLFLVLISFFFWFARMIFSDKELSFRKTPFNIPILAFSLVAILSAVFSVDRISSIFGYYGRFSDGLITLLGLVIFYFLVVNNAKLINVEKLIKTLLWSSLFIIIISYLSVFGIWAEINSKLAGGAFLQRMANVSFNPTSGSMEALAVFLSTLMVFLVGLIIFSDKQFNRIFLWLLFISSLILVFFISFKPIWIILASSLILFLFLSLILKLKNKKSLVLILPLVIIIISSVFIFYPSSKIIEKTALKNPQSILYLEGLENKEIFLDQKISWHIAKETLKSRPIFGSGIGTYFYDFVKFKPLEYNESSLWRVRLDRAGNSIIEIVATAGIIGVITFLLLIVLILFFFIKKIAGITPLKGNEKLAKTNTVSLFFLFLAVFIAQFVYYQNITLAFIFWLSLALLVIIFCPPATRKISLNSFSESKLVFVVLLTITGIIIGTIFFLGGKFYLADNFFLKGFTKNQLDQLENRISDFNKAAELNPYQAQYRIYLSQAYLTRGIIESNKPADEQNSVKIACDVSLSIAYAKGQEVEKNCLFPGAPIDEKIKIKGATQISPNQVACWENLGVIYQRLQSIASGSLDWGIKSFEKTIELEPKNPALHTELGKLYIAKGEIKKGKEEFKKAIALKYNYADSYLQLALSYEKEEDLEEAINTLAEFKKLLPEKIAAGNISLIDIEAIFHLGRIYYNNDQINPAIEEFQNVVSLVPNHSNAHYSLGIAYSIIGEKEKAIEEFKIVLALNPGNKDVLEKLEKLQSESEEE